MWWACAGALCLHVGAVMIWQEADLSFPVDRPAAGRARIDTRIVAPTDLVPRLASLAAGGAPVDGRAEDGATPALPPVDAADVGRPDPAPPTDLGDGLYAPREALTTAPTALQPVLLDYPDSLPPGHFKATLTLFIEADGVVSRVRLDSGFLPPELVASTLAAFQAARFSPGRIGERNVPARKQVEVEFNADPPVREAGSPGLNGP